MYNLIPRHKRLGIVVRPKLQDAFICNSISVPIMNNGILIGTETCYENVPVNEHYSKFKTEDFKLRSLLDAGVDLKQMNVVFGHTRDVIDVENALRKLDGLSQVVDYVEKQKATNSVTLNSNPDVESQN